MMGHRGRGVMKTHLWVGSRTACCDFVPRDALLTVNVRLVTCKLCRRTRLFVRAVRGQALFHRKSRGKIEQMELF